MLAGYRFTISNGRLLIGPPPLVPAQEHLAYDRVFAVRSERRRLSRRTVSSAYDFRPLIISLTLT